jgi:hypothetical protein
MMKARHFAQMEHPEDDLQSILSALGEFEDDIRNSEGTDSETESDDEQLEMLDDEPEPFQAEPEPELVHEPTSVVPIPVPQPAPAPVPQPAAPKQASVSPKKPKEAVSDPPKTAKPTEKIQLPGMGRRGTMPAPPPSRGMTKSLTPPPKPPKVGAPAKAIPAADPIPAPAPAATPSCRSHQHLKGNPSKRNRPRQKWPFWILS